MRKHTFNGPRGPAKVVKLDDTNIVIHTNPTKRSWLTRHFGMCVQRMPDADGKSYLHVTFWYPHLKYRHWCSYRYASFRWF